MPAFSYNSFHFPHHHHHHHLTRKRYIPTSFRSMSYRPLSLLTNSWKKKELKRQKLLLFLLLLLGLLFFHSALRGCAVLFAPYIATRSESVIFQSPPVGRHRPLLLFLLLSLVVRLCIFNVFLQFYKFNTFCSSFSAFEKNLTCIDLCSE